MAEQALIKEESKESVEKVFVKEESKDIVEESRKACKIRSGVSHR